MRQISARAAIITRTKYSRPLDGTETRFEAWGQTVARVIGHQRWLWERAQEGPLTPAQEAELGDLTQLMLDRQSMPAGRVLWLGGTELVKRRESAGFNCLGVETKFITNRGVYSFENCVDGDEFTVLTHTGAWKKAVVRSYGRRPLYRIVLHRGRSVQTVRATADHRWILKDGAETKCLQVGDTLIRPPAPFNDWSYYDAPPEQRVYWAYGFVYGDGTLTHGKDGRVIGSMVRLCGAKNEHTPKFEELGFKTSYPPSCGGDAFAYTGSYQKAFPEIGVDGVSLTTAFVRGYLDADGGKNPNHTRDPGSSPFRSIQVTGSDSNLRVSDTFPCVGVYITSEEQVTGDTNYGPRSSETVRYGITTKFGESNGAYRVASIEPDTEEEVWCLEVEDDHSFVMPNGIVTGNCAFTEVSTIHDAVDVFWLLLQGCGVGFRPVPGRLTGFPRKVELEVIRSTRTAKGGCEVNLETYDPPSRTWTVAVGDSAEAWAKSIGKLLAHPYAARKLVLDLSQLRPSGIRLRGYGWMSSGDANLCDAYSAVVAILNRRAGRLLTKEDIWDIVNWLGTVLSSRRSAQIGIIDDGDSEAATISARKYPGFDRGPDWYRGQSNNTIVFHEKPTARRLKHLFEQMAANGGSEPGFCNAAEAIRRAPWFKGPNPCFEILLGGFCNLTETDVASFRNDDRGLHDALSLIARANYRQTCVNLRDGILQSHWHEQNEYLRLCGVGICGYVRRPDLTAYDLRQMKYAATFGAYSMADELGRERPKNVTCSKPGGTVPKIMDTTEGIKRPDGRYLLNRVNFRRDDPIMARLVGAGYQVEPHPSVADSCLVVLPYEYRDVAFGRHADGTPVNDESAIAQLERYRFVMDHYCEQNASTTIGWSPEEIPALVRWFDRYWDHVVGVSFCFRNDHTRTAKDLGYSYLPQSVVDRETFARYAADIRPVDLDDVGDLDGFDSVRGVGECDAGMCPSR